MKIYGIAITLAATLLVSCSRDEGAAPGGGRRELAVDVQMQNSDWQTRSGGDSAADGTLGGGLAAEGTHDRTQVLGSVALDEQLEIVAECGKQDTPEYGTSEALTPDAPFTRGTPANSVTSLKSMGISVYTNSTFARTLTATSNGGSWVIANNIALDLDKNKYSYYAYAPVAAADNGIVLQADGKKLTYTAPDDIIKQPDLCWATPIKDAPTSTVTFAMQHALTAVGIKVRADNVEIQSIKLLNVNTSGTLDLTTGAWTGQGAVKNLAFTLANNKPETGNDVVNITPNDGYLILPPQALTGDNKKLEIVYKYNGETTWRTGTHSLNTLTGGAWAAGQKVHYIIQLKAKFTLTLTPASAKVPDVAGSYTFKYTTGSFAGIDPQVSRPGSDTWISDLTVNRSDGSGTITFNYATNTMTVERKTAITVTSGFTTQTFVFTQDSPYVLIAGTKWTRSNLTGTASTNTGHRLDANPQGTGMFFKWGSTFVYQRESSNSDGGGWGGDTNGAATTPELSTTSSNGYDYIGLVGGLNPGDPCQKLGSNCKTPTKTQWIALHASGSFLATYQGMIGYFFGPSARSCNNTTIQPGCIFLPFTGNRYNMNGRLEEANMCSAYWSSSATVYQKSTGHCFFNTKDEIISDFKLQRGYGVAVRCIYE